MRLGGEVGIYCRRDHGTAENSSSSGKGIPMRAGKEAIMPVGHLRFKVTIAVICRG